MTSKNNRISKSYKIKVGLTIGDPSGIGPEITLKAIKALNGAFDLVVIGDAWVLKKAQDPRRKTHDPRIIDLNNVSRKNFKFGQIKAEYGRASVEYLDTALDLLKNKEIDCLVTCPISKEAINLAGFNYSGHTEYFRDKTGAKQAVMMLLNNELKFSLVTRHIPLKDVSAALNQNNIYNTVSLTRKSLIEIFGIKKPRIVVCGLNPHASDNGVIGKEEKRKIIPALNKFKNRISGIDGPLPADIAISKAYDNHYDAVIAMYHDQALIPLKLGQSGSGVNITLGLPFIRTSPLHGTAFDIAGSSKANPLSLIEAIKLAAKCVLFQKKA